MEFLKAAFLWVFILIIFLLPPYCESISDSPAAMEKITKEISECRTKCEKVGFEFRSLSFTGCHCKVPGGSR